MRGRTWFAAAAAAVSFALGMGLSASRSGAELNPPAPPETAAPAAPAPPESTLAATLSVSRGDLQRLAEEKLPSLIQGTSPVREGILSGKLFFQARKVGVASVDLRDGKIFLSVPVEISARFKGEISALGIALPAEAQAGGACIAAVAMSPQLQADWSLRTRSELSLTWTRSPVVEVAGLEVTLKGEAESFLNQKVRELAPRFDAAANEGLHVRNAAEGAWLSLREPVRIGESPDLWLSAAPVAIAASPLEISRDRVLLRTSLRARLLLTAGTRPEPSPLRALPPLRVLPPGDPTLRVHLPVLLTHRAVAERLKTEAVGRSLDLGGAVLEVRDARVYGSGGRLILGLDIRTSAGTGAFAPSAAGTIYLGGRPKLDPKRQVLSVEDVSFDLPTKGILAEAASWLLTPVLAGAIQSALVFPLDGAIRDAKAQIERFLRGTRIGGGFFLSGTLKELRLDSLRVRKEGTEALAAVTGVLSLDWRPARRGGGSP